MSEPRIRVIASESGITFTSTGLVVLKESLDLFNKVLGAPPTERRRDFELVLSFMHEGIHFLQAMTSAYLLNLSNELVQTGLMLLKNVDKLRDIPVNQKPLFWQSVQRINYRDSQEQISCRDILEGVAVLESFKLAAPYPSPEKFMAFRDEFFPGSTDSCYRRSYDWLAQKMGNYAAYDLLAPLSFAAFMGDEPPTNFISIVTEIQRDNAWSDFVGVPTKDICEEFGLDLENYFLSQLEHIPVDESAPIPAKCIKAAGNHIESDRLIEVAGRPHLLNSIFSEEELDWLLPPIVVFSSSPRKKHAGRTFGLARHDPTFRQLCIHITGLLGAAERLVGLVEKNNIYQFCSHSTACPHYSSALCFQYYAPPSQELGHEECGFANYFTGFVGHDPSFVWKPTGCR